jgi:hypothetical protein
LTARVARLFVLAETERFDDGFLAPNFIFAF